MKKVTRDRLNYLSQTFTGVSSKWQKWQKLPEFKVYNPEKDRMESPNEDQLLSALELIYEQAILGELRLSEPDDYTFAMAAFLTFEEKNRYNLILKKYTSDNSFDDIAQELPKRVRDLIEANTAEFDDNKNLDEITGYDYNEFVSYCHFCTKSPEKAKEKLEEALKQGEEFYVSKRSVG